jgi:putative ubiquitin-RnfH superfamily antitoxin RatB of RatAB toxin-antitoxin module
MKISMAYSPAPREVLECELELPAGSTLEAALRASGWLQCHPELAGHEIGCGIWGRKAAPDTLLRDRDRVEFWRALRVDPKVARRERFKSQGAKTAGLFAQRRPGAKWGY